MAALNLPTGRPGRFLALAITLLALGILWAVVGAPLWDLYQSGAERLTERAAIAQRMEALAAQLPELRERSASGARVGAMPSFTIEGASDAVAAATLQNALQEMASGVGANLQSVEIVPAQPAGSDYRRVGLKVTLDTPWAVLVALLRAVAGSPTPYLIDDLEVHATPATANLPNNPLDATFSVYAFRAAGSASGGAP